MRLSSFVRLVPLAVLAACGGGGADQPAVDSVATVPEEPLPTSVAARIVADIGDSASVIEGIAIHDGKVYTADWKDGAIYRIDPAEGTPVKVGALPITSGQWILGLATDAEGNLYAAVPQTGTVYKVAAKRLGAKDFDAAKDAVAFVTGATGANALAFDANGHLFIAGGDAGAVYHVGPEGGAAAVFAKGYAPVNPDTTMPVRAFVVNGAAFDSKGFFYTGNTGTGTISKLVVKPDYTVGAITTFVADPRLVGVDGLAIGTADTLWVTANFKNTLAKIAPDGTVKLQYLDAVRGGMLRFPAELEVVGTTAYVANLNFPIGNNEGSAKGASVAAVEVP